jgi:6-phosphogluconolactonase
LLKTVQIARDEEAVARLAAEEIVERAAAAIAARGSFTWVLSGGSTPRRLYRLLAGDPSFRDRMPWPETSLFWGDERAVPPDHPDSNFRLAWEAMLSRVPAPAERVHRWPAELPPEEAARAYEATLRQAAGELPRFDLVLLGLGVDCHTASLFPGSPVLAERERLTAAPWVPALGTRRLTLTPPALNAARCALFLVTGEEKAEALRAALAPQGDPADCPARAIRPTAGDLLWLADRAAAALLPFAGSSGFAQANPRRPG